MFDEISGIPAHPLLVHAAVVFIPLQILLGIGYALVPALQRRIGWAVLATAVIGPVAAFFAKESGEAFEDRLVKGGMTELTKVHEHADFAEVTLWLSLALGVLVIVLMLVERRRRTAPPAATDADAAAPTAPSGGAKYLALLLAVAVVVVGVATGYYVYKTGDTGAKMVWSGL
ncbi:hypothetical protein GCM10009682_22630 [Luedemannella flava]|uniref:DUF2231 domain-containing protein n=1 Tax=Luedemannella flava TaxID=349316 RepID=A0ABN2LVF7_9ACTN